MGLGRPRGLLLHHRLRLVIIYRMRFGLALKWLTGQDKDPVAEPSNPKVDRDTIKPILFDQSLLHAETPDAELEERDNATLDKMENYYYKEVDTQQIVKFLFEKVPKKQEELHIEYCEERLEGFDELLRAIGNKLMRKSAGNYDKFCVGIQTVADIKHIVLAQCEQFAVAKQKHELLKSYYARHVQSLIANRKRLSRKKVVLEALEYIEQQASFLLFAYRQMLAVHQATEAPRVQSIVREMLSQISRFTSIEKTLEQSLRERSPKLVPIATRLQGIASKGISLLTKESQQS